MPFLLIAFPVFDPIAIAIGPIAIRWYALAYIGGIVLGWIYARSLLKNEKPWGGPAPISMRRRISASRGATSVMADATASAAAPTR